MKLLLASLLPLSIAACSAPDAREPVGTASEAFGAGHCFSPSDVPECPLNSQPQICSGPFQAPPHCVPVVPPIVHAQSTIWCCGF